MTRIENSDMWESLLGLAVTEYSYRELDQYPSEEEMNRLKLPDEYDKKMRRWIKNYKTKTKIAAMIIPLRKVAVAVCVIMGIGFACLLQFDEVRAACREVMVQVYEKYIEFKYQTSDQAKMSDLQVGYVPAGYYEEKRAIKKLTTMVEYRTEQSESLVITYSVEELVYQIDNEHYSMSQELVNEVDSTFFESTEKGRDNYLLWQGEDGYYSIKSLLEKEEMIKVAENIK